jgi:hypothetical protein
VTYEADHLRCGSADEDGEGGSSQPAAGDGMEQLVLCVARSNVEVVEGDGLAIQEILVDLQPSIEGDQRSLRLHLLATAFKQACFPTVSTPIGPMAGHPYLCIVTIGTTHSHTSVALW